MTDQAPALRDADRERGPLDERALSLLQRLAQLRSGDLVVWVGEDAEIAAAWSQKLGCRLWELSDLDEVSTLERGSVALAVVAKVESLQGFEEALEGLRPSLDEDGVVALAVRSALEEGDVKDGGSGDAPRLKELLSEFAAQSYEPLHFDLASPGSSSPTSPAGASRAVLGLLVGRRLDPGSPPRWPRRRGAEEGGEGE